MSDAAKVTVYTKRRCPHCVRARRRLRRKNVEFEEIRAGSDVEGARLDLRARFGSDTFPQIVIGERHIGGADQLVALEKSGELRALLRPNCGAGVNGTVSP